MPCCGRIGQQVEISRMGEEEVSVEWQIWDVLSLPGGNGDWYRSPLFRIDDDVECWWLRLLPNWKSATQNPASGWVRLALCRWSPAPPETFHFSVGIRGSRGVEKRREGKKEFKGHDIYVWNDFCSRFELVEHATRLMPDGDFNIRCVLKRPGAATAYGPLFRWARGLLSPILTAASSALSPYPSIQADSAITVPAAPTNRSHSFEKRGITSFQDSCTQTNGEFKEQNTLTGGIQPLDKTAASDDYAEEENNENNGDEDNKESKNKKNVNLLSPVKNTKKISLPTRHGNVIRSLKAILTGGKRADFTLKSGAGGWAVHRAILEGRSGHFETLFRGEWAERDEVRLDDVAEVALDGVLHFVYAGEVLGDMSFESLCGIYVAAHQFLLEDLKSLCVEYMKDRMCPEMVCGALAVAETYGEGDLKESALQCFFRESDRIFEMEEWKHFKENHPAIIAELLVENFKRKRRDAGQ